MNDKIKSKKTIAYGIVLLFIVALFVIVAILPSKSEILASKEVFNDIDFQSKNADVDGYKVDFRNEEKEIYTELQLSEDEKIAIIKAIENSKFERISISDTYNEDSYYLINITLNKRYELNLDSTHKILIFSNKYDNDSDHLYYRLSNDGGLFKLLEE